MFHKLFVALAYLLGFTVLTTFTLGVRADSSTQGEWPADPFGVYVWPSGSQIPGSTELKTAGAQWVGLNMQWASIEKNHGQYDWSHYDRLLGNAAAEGFQIIVTIGQNPEWAADTSCGPIHADSLSAFATFLNAAVRRYSVPPYNVLHWALYNEPDNSNASPYFTKWLGGCWGGPVHPNAVPGAGGAAYANMLSYAYPAIKAGNPQAQVLLGGLAYDYFAELDDNGIFDPYFVDNILAAGGGEHFDIINFHYYNHFDWRWQDDDNGFDPYNHGITYKAHYLQEEVRRYLNETKPIICTEAGAGSLNGLGEDRSDRQARYVVQTFVRAKYADIHPLLWFEGVDETWLPGYVMSSMGLLAHDLTTKISYQTYQTLTQELSGAQFVRVRDDLDTRFEGYEFEINGRRKNVIWTTEEAPAAISLALSQSGGMMRMVEKDGYQTYIADGSAEDIDGELNGFVGVSVSQSPRYFEDLSMPTYTPTATSTPRPTVTPTPTLLPGHYLRYYLPLTWNE